MILFFDIDSKGCLTTPKRMNFRKRGSFSIQKFVLQIFAIIDDTSVMNFGKKLQYDFLKMMGEGSKAVWKFSENSSVLVALGFLGRV